MAYNTLATPSKSQHSSSDHKDTDERAWNFHATHVGQSRAVIIVNRGSVTVGKSMVALHTQKREIKYY